MTTTAQGTTNRPDNIPAHIGLLEPWPVPGECQWLSGCRNPAHDNDLCASHGEFMARAWARVGVIVP